MIVQIFKTRCEDCGEEVKNAVGILDGDIEIIVDFVDGMEFYCESCDSTTHIQIEKFTD